MRRPGESIDLPRVPAPRSLRIIDGPDEVHRRSLGRLELARFAPP